MLAAILAGSRIRSSPLQELVMVVVQFWVSVMGGKMDRVERIF
jgi:hypothetical protein